MGGGYVIDEARRIGGGAREVRGMKQYGGREWEGMTEAGVRVDRSPRSLHRRWDAKEIQLQIFFYNFREISKKISVIRGHGAFENHLPRVRPYSDRHPPTPAPRLPTPLHRRHSSQLPIHLHLPQPPPY